MKNRVRELRGQRDLSQQALGDALGVSRQTIISIENGKYDPSLPLAFKIARLFAMPIEKFSMMKRAKAADKFYRFPSCMKMDGLLLPGEAINGISDREGKMRRSPRLIFLLALVFGLIFAGTYALLRLI